MTITGADESIAPWDLVSLAEEYPFVEWGILVSKSSEGSPRFPGRAWVNALVDAAPPEVGLSLHVCGRWVRDLMLGVNSLWSELGALEGGRRWNIGRFQRVQLNFHAVYYPARLDAAAALFHRNLAHRQIIIQMDGPSNAALLWELRGAGLDCVPLFDTSGGAGIVPRVWPRTMAGVPYHGYAGGLGPETLEHELGRIGDVAGEAPVWIDMERRVRTDDDAKFDVDKVHRCLAICAPLVATA